MLYKTVIKKKLNINRYFRNSPSSSNSSCVTSISHNSSGSCRNSYEIKYQQQSLLLSSSSPIMVTVAVVTIIVTTVVVTAVVVKIVANVASLRPIVCIW